MDEKIKSSETFPHIKDPAFIGGNCVMLFDILGFLELYFSVPYEGPLFYFDSQFDEPMFKGKNLFHYFSCPENTILACANGVLNQTITKEAFVTFMSTEI